MAVAGRPTGRARLRARQMMVIGEVALSVVLIVGGGLMIRTVQRMMSIDPGFRSDGVLTMELSVPSTRYASGESIAAFYEELRHRVDALPGVQRAAVARLVPLAAPIGNMGLRIPGYTPPPGENTPGDWQIVSPGYFETMRLHLNAGRLFDERDQSASPLVFVISQRMAEKYFAGRDPIGANMEMSNDSAKMGTVIGVVRRRRAKRAHRRAEPDVLRGAFAVPSFGTIHAAHDEPRGAHHRRSARARACRARAGARARSGDSGRAHPHDGRRRQRLHRAAAILDAAARRLRCARAGARAWWASTASSRSSWRRGGRSSACAPRWERRRGRSCGCRCWMGCSRRRSDSRSVLWPRYCSRA